MERRTLWTILGGGAALGLGALIFGGRAQISAAAAEVAASLQRVFTAAGREAFALVLPSRSQPYADFLLDAAIKRGLNPFTLWALMERESLSGAYLQPKNSPAGTGDPTPRWFVTIPSWANDAGLVSGATRVNAAGDTENEVVPPAAGGATVPGWGYGLMQIDWVSWRPFIESGDWKDPQKNIDKGAEILLSAVDFFRAPPSTAGIRYAGSVIGGPDADFDDPRPLSGTPLVDAALAAYNAGQTHVLWAIAQGRTPDSVTTKKNYASDVRQRALALITTFTAAVPGFTSELV